MSAASETLNLAYHEKRLIVLALRRTAGNVTEAYRLNVPCGKFMSERTYYGRLREFGINSKDYKCRKLKSLT